MTTKPKYSHAQEYTKYGNSSLIDQSMMALNAFVKIESLTNELEEKENELEKAMDKIRNLQKNK